MMPAIKEAFNIIGDDIVELGVENEFLKNQIGDYDEKRASRIKSKAIERYR